MERFVQGISVLVLMIEGKCSPFRAKAAHISGHLPLGFVGFNTGFLHVPAAEIGTLWLCAALEGELELPLVEQMEQDIEQVRQWKNAHIQFEPTRGSGVNVRYQQYIQPVARYSIWALLSMY